MSNKKGQETKITPENIEKLNKIVQDLYCSDKVPWVIGYSGGKDSTATLQVIWNAILGLKAEERHKPVYVISTNTLVESPIVDNWVSESLQKMESTAKEQEVPFYVYQLTPEITETYWVLLIGRGYPAPRPTFRWCTDRLKIKPSNKFITNAVAKHGEVILALGTRSAESSKRAARMKNYEKQRVRELLSPTKELLNCLVFTPIEDWSNDDVWIYLMQYANPWGQSNMELMTMYRGASEDGECPFVRDTETPSCGNSRFGCWVCTMVQKDKSMQAMIQNDDEKEWMTPLLELRDEIGILDEKGNFIDDRHRRDFRRMQGHVLIYKGRAVHGPYTKEWREHWLRRLLEVEKTIQKIGPIKDLRLISDEELRWIRRIWVLEKHEFDDSLPQIYEEVTGQKYKYYYDLETTFGKDEWDLLRDICGEDDIFFQLQTTLLDITQQRFGFVRRKGVLKELEQAIQWCYYEGEDEAVKIVKEKTEKEKAIKDAEIHELLYQGVEKNNNSRDKTQ